MHLLGDLCRAIMVSDSPYDPENAALRGVEERPPLPNGRGAGGEGVGGANMIFDRRRFARPRRLPKILCGSACAARR